MAKSRFLQHLGRLPVVQQLAALPKPKPDWQLRLEAEQKARALVLFKVKEEAEHLALLRVSRGLQLQSLWGIPTAAVSSHQSRRQAAETVVATMNEVAAWCAAAAAAAPPPHGLPYSTMALITSDCGAMRSLSNKWPESPRIAGSAGRGSSTSRWASSRPVSTTCSSWCAARARVE